MRLAGFVITGAVVAAAGYLTVTGAILGPESGEAKTDLSVQAIVVFAVLIALVLACLVGIAAEVRHIARRRGGHRPRSI